MIRNVAGSTNLDDSIIFHFDGEIDEANKPLAGYFCKVDANKLVVGAGATADDYLGVTTASTTNLGKDCDVGDADEYLVEGTVFLVVDSGVVPKEGDFVDIAGNGKAKIGTTNKIGIFLGVKGEPNTAGEDCYLAWIKG